MQARQGQWDQNPSCVEPAEAGLPVATNFSSTFEQTLIGEYVKNDSPACWDQARMTDGHQQVEYPIWHKARAEPRFNPVLTANIDK